MNTRAATDTIEQINPETLEELVVVSVSTGTTWWYYYANGKLSRSEQHDENKKIGEWESYDSLGNWLKTEVYMNDTLIKTKDRKNYAPDKQVLLIFISHGTHIAINDFNTLNCKCFAIPP
jgi:hypothetical protein